MTGLQRGALTRCAVSAPLQPWWDGAAQGRVPAPQNGGAVVGQASPAPVACRSTCRSSGTMTERCCPAMERLGWGACLPPLWGRSRAWRRAVRQSAALQASFQSGTPACPGRGSTMQFTAHWRCSACKASCVRTRSCAVGRQGRLCKSRHGHLLASSCPGIGDRIAQPAPVHPTGLRRSLRP